MSDEVLRIERRNPPMQAAPVGHFDGEVALAIFVGASLGIELTPRDSMILVQFKDGAVNHWHRHGSRQILLFTDGRGIVEVRDGERLEMAPGEVAIVAAETVHRHGAAVGRDCTHVAIEEGLAEWVD